MLSVFNHTIARLAHGADALLIVTAVTWGQILLAKPYNIMRNQT